MTPTSEPTSAAADSSPASTRPLVARQILDWLGDADRYGDWINSLASVDDGTHPFDPVCPTSRHLQALGLDQAAIDEFQSTRPNPVQDAELWWLWRRCAAVLKGRIGQLGMVDWPDLPASVGPVGRYFYAHVFLSVLDTTVAWHAARGIPEGITRITLADLGVKIESYRRTWGVGGLDRQNWLSQHFSGAIFRLGRLQFDRGRVPRHIGMTPIPNSPRAGPGARALGIHIPEGGALTTAACDDSLSRAQNFFPRYFPDERYDIAACYSWLLDDQLLGYLPRSANITRFQRRFTIWPGFVNGDVDVADFVFRRRIDNLAGVPQHTTLQRAIIDHLNAGRHWRIRGGWLSL